MSRPNAGNPEVDIPPELLITNFDDPIAAIVQSTYPNLLSQLQNGRPEENKNHDLRAFLDELSNATPETSIKVRVARMWDTLNLNKQKGLISTDMVLIDEKANYIHATTPRWDSPKIKTKLREGKVYVISKFEVSKNRQRYAVVERNSLELHLPGDVTVIEEDCGDIEIPRHIFEFVDFDNLPKRNGKEVYSDVIGVVTCVNPIEERTTVNGKVDMMSLQLKNGRGDVFKVTLWDEYVAIFNQTLKEQMYDAPKPNVAIFTSVTVKQYQGELLAQSSRSTKIYVNIDIPEVDDLIRSFRGDANIANASPTVNYAGISQVNP
ncbi:hypothetical protein P8452_46127 [Trifolium repens]|nr:hypothetical protein P8452_46127 [Trifolium repens]